VAGSPWSPSAKQDRRYLVVHHVGDRGERVAARLQPAHEGEPVQVLLSVPPGTPAKLRPRQDAELVVEADGADGQTATIGELTDPHGDAVQITPPVHSAVATG
jgi:hypothetical protein